MTVSSLASSLEAALGEALDLLHPVSGGDINDAYCATWVDGRRVFVKTNAHAPAGMFAAEAAGLAWLGEGGDELRVPAVLAQSETWLALEWIERGPSGPDSDEALGRGLATLHASLPSDAPFGAVPDNFIGTLAQSNADTVSWAEFYAEQRLLPLAHAAHTAGQLDASHVSTLEAVCLRLPNLVDPAEPPSRLHGDLWGGNAMFDAQGQPVVFDPAVYAGHREVDLAMMKLFGGFSPRVFAAYEEAAKLSPNWKQRVSLWQLYPLLVHVRLFGKSYVGQLMRAAAPWV